MRRRDIPKKKEGTKMAINQRVNMIRTTTYLPPAYKAWLDKESSETGLTISNLIVIAVKTYIDSQDYLRLFPVIDQRLRELSIMSGGIDHNPPLTTLQQIEKELEEEKEKKENELGTHEEL
jgi:hypothetical protein